MPRYFFHYRDGDKATEDVEGTELANEVESVLEAMISAKEIIAEAFFSGEAVPRDAEFSVTDTEHRQLYVFPFSLAADQPTDRISQKMKAVSAAPKLEAQRFGFPPPLRVTQSDSYTGVGQVKKERLCSTLLP